jgi:hypothetical protein
MTILKIILFLVVAPFVLGFCYFVGSFFIDIIMKDKNNSKETINENKWGNRIVRIIIGIIIVMVLGKAMEKAGCSSNEDKYYRM